MSALSNRSEGSDKTADCGGAPVNPRHYCALDDLLKIAHVVDNSMVFTRGEQ